LDIRDDDFGAFLRQAVGISFADPNAAAGDDRYFVFQTHGVPP